ncbi:MAG: hypothetical protein ABJC13_20825 [Acidobacteriota bacterium]
MKIVRRFIPLVGVALALASSLPVLADEVCMETASAALSACRSSAQDAFQLASGTCINLELDSAEAQCLREAQTARTEALSACNLQKASRLDICARLGGAPYDPNVSPARFDSDLAHLTRPNPYFPLRVGHRWEFGGAESVEIEVLDRTKLIAGVTCFVVRDVVSVDGIVHEDTEDWFAQAKTGDTYYFGEEVKDYEVFEGDEPPTPELISIDGSFKTGREGAKPGLAFPIAPRPGLFYRQEFSLGNAEDVADVVTTSYKYGRNAELDRLVPRALAELLCAAGDCVVTKEFQPLAPGIFERKFYTKNIGGFLVIHLDTGEVVQLVGCNMDPRCASLPRP